MKRNESAPCGKESDGRWRRDSGRRPSPIERCKLDGVTVQLIWCIVLRVLQVIRDYRGRESEREEPGLDCRINLHGAGSVCVNLHAGVTCRLPATDREPGAPRKKRKRKKKIMMMMIKMRKRERERERERENIKKRNERKYKKWNWKDDSNSWWILSAGKFSAGAVIAARRQPPGSVLRSSACLRREERHRRHRLPFPLLMDVARARDSLMSVVAMMRMFL